MKATIQRLLAALVFISSVELHATHGDYRDQAQLLANPAMKAWVEEQNSYLDDDEIGPEVLSAGELEQYAENDDGKTMNDASKGKGIEEDKSADKKKADDKKKPEKVSAVAPVEGPIYAYFHDHRRPSHQGVDIGAKIGTPIRAAWGGRVLWANCDDPIGGCTVKIDHGNGLFTYYAHMRNEPSVQARQHVNKGQVLGPVGKTGDADRPEVPSHLHFEVRRGHKPLNPLQFVDLFKNKKAIQVAAKFTGR